MPALTALSAAALDVALMSRGAFSLASLVELAGQAVALATYATYPPSSYGRVLVVCGSGNQGLDGLAAARWLATLKYSPSVVLPRPPPADARPVEAALSAALRMQLASAAPAARVLPAVPAPAELASSFDLIVDALFGFSFKGPPHGVLGEALAAIVAAQRSGDYANCSTNTAAVDMSGDALPLPPHSRLPIVSVDIPSGWHVELGDETGVGLRPDVLVSLSAPKVCAASFTGDHWLGGRFIPDSLAEEFNISEFTAAYTGSDLVTRLS